MPLSNYQRGSAVVEFVMLAAPSLFLFGSGITFFLNSYIDSVARVIAVDSARYAALADQDYFSAASYLNKKVKQHLPQIDVSTNISLGENARVELQYAPFISLFNVQTKRVQIKAVTPVEVRQ